jgi:hypothetical protein
VGKLIRGEATTSFRHGDKKKKKLQVCGSVVNVCERCID